MSPTLICGDRKETVRDAGDPRHDAAQRAAPGQPTRAAIVTAAGELVSLEGLDRLSMRRLAAAVGISKSALYQHFASKEELQLAVIGHSRDVFEAEVVRDPPRDNAQHGLGLLLERWLAFFEDKVFPGGCFFISSAVDFASRPGRVRNALEKALDREVEVLEAAILRAREAGELIAEKHAGQTAFELHAILLHAHALHQVKRDPAMLAHARAALRKVLGESEERESRAAGPPLA